MVSKIKEHDETYHPDWYLKDRDFVPKLHELHSHILAAKVWFHCNTLMTRHLSKWSNCTGQWATDCWWRAIIKAKDTKSKRVAAIHHGCNWQWATGWSGWMWFVFDLYLILGMVSPPIFNKFSLSSLQLNCKARQWHSMAARIQTAHSSQLLLIAFEL